MKRAVVGLIFLALLLPMVLGLSLSTGAELPIIATDKEVYLPGEDVLITAAYTGEGSWVGIAAADVNGDPVTTKGALWWRYIPEGGCEGATFADLGKDYTLAAGRYCVVACPEDTSVKNGVEKGILSYVTITVADKLTMEKTTFLYGEDIWVTPLTVSNPGKDYVGVSRVENDGTVRHNMLYTYITEDNVNTAFNLKNASSGNADPAYHYLPAGRYVVYWCANDRGVASRDTTSDIYIEIVGATLEKTEFKYGEPITVTAYGSEKDWIGISPVDATTDSGLWSNKAVRWRYIAYETSNTGTTGLGSGVSFDIREAYLASGCDAYADLPAGDYILFVSPSAVQQVTGGIPTCNYIPITITAQKPDVPTALTYELDDPRTGLAGGVLTVTFAEASMETYKKPTRVELYWADADGSALAGYNMIGTRKITGTVTEIALADSMVIPVEAKKLMVRALNGAGYSEAVAAILPSTRSYRTTGERITSFQIVSDMHVLESETAQNNAHAAAMFADILANDPSSVGIFVAGDAADHGQVAEYERLLALWEASGLSTKLYLGVGNHEMCKDTSSHGYNDSYADSSNRFIEYANKSLEEAEKTEKPYYYINRGGQHFVFLATEYCGTHAYLSDAQLAWLDATLGQIAADGAPVFILLHQPLYNTVAGGLANADGSLRQGWHGVIAGDENFAKWVALTEENDVSTSNHTLMYDQYEQPFRDILAKYPSAMMFSGHSHWILESVGNIFEGSDTLPNYLFNTSSVATPWTDGDELNAGYSAGEASQGYYVTVYENCIEFRGRDFLNGTWIPNAYYRIWLNCAHEYDEGDTTCKWCGEPNEAYQGIVFKDTNGNVLSFADTSEAGSVSIPQYAVTDSTLGVLIGWMDANNGNGSFFPVDGEITYEAGDTAVYEPVLLRMSSTGQPSVRFTQGSTGMRFTTEIPLADWLKIADFAERGTLIVPESYVDRIGGTLTHAALDAANAQRLDVKASDWYIEDEMLGTFAGSIANIKVQNHARNFIGLGYVKITYSNGRTAYFYAANSETAICSVYAIAYDALHDRSDVQEGKYEVEMPDGSYSPYNAYQIEILKGFLAPVVALTGNASETGATLTASDLYVQEGVTLTVLLAGEDSSAGSTAGNWGAYAAILGDAASDATGIWVIEKMGGFDADTLCGVTLDRVQISYVLHEGKLLVAFSTYSDFH